MSKELEDQPKTKGVRIIHRYVLEVQRGSNGPIEIVCTNARETFLVKGVVSNVQTNQD